MSISSKDGRPPVPRLERRRHPLSRKFALWECAARWRLVYPPGCSPIGILFQSIVIAPKRSPVPIRRHAPPPLAQASGATNPLPVCIVYPFETFHLDGIRRVVFGIRLLPRIIMIFETRLFIPFHG